MGDDANRLALVNSERRDMGIPASYALALPAGWIHLSAGTPDEMLRQADRSFASSPGDNWRAEVGSLFEAAYAPDTSHSVLDTFMTSGPVPGTSIAASITVARAALAEAVNHSAEDVLLARSLGAGAEVLSVAGSVAVLTPLDQPPALPRGSARVLSSTSVLLAVPQRDDFLLALVFTVLTDQAPTGPDLHAAETRVNSSLVELFRALLTTFRWIDDGGAVMQASPGEHDD